MATSLLWPPVLAAQQNGHTFSCKDTLFNTVTSLLWPIFFGGPHWWPYYQGSTVLHAYSPGLSRILQVSESPRWNWILSSLCFSLEFTWLLPKLWNFFDHSMVSMAQKGQVKRSWLMFARYGKRDSLWILNYSPEVGMSGNSYFHCHKKKHLLLFLNLETYLVWVVIDLYFCNPMKHLVLRAWWCHQKIS